MFVGEVGKDGGGTELEVAYGTRQGVRTSSLQLTISA